MFGWKLIKEEQFEEMENLIGTLDSFIFVAKTDGSRSRAVEFADNEMKAYKRKWNWRSYVQND